jgi:hypothetical protein
LQGSGYATVGGATARFLDWFACDGGPSAAAAVGCRPAIHGRTAPATSVPAGARTTSPDGRSRLYVLGGLLFAFSAAAAVVLMSVLRVVLFAIAVAYVLYPIRQRVRSRGASRRVSSAAATTVGFLIVVALLVEVVDMLSEHGSPRQTTL